MIGRMVTGWVHLAAVGLLGMTVSAAVVYQDPLNGATSGDLNGTSPADRGGVGAAAWAANTQFNEDGSVVGATAGGAWLPFVPVAGNVCRVSAKVNTTSGGSDWLSFGFADTADTGMYALGNGGYASVLLRHDRGAGQGFTFVGPDSTGGVPFDAPTGVVKVDIVLNAKSASATNWTIRL